MQAPYEQWLTATPVLLVLANLLFLWLLYRAVPTGAAASGAATEDAEEYVGGDAVECPTCGESNEPGYRFCRNCVGELPGAPGFREDSPSQFTRGAL